MVAAVAAEDETPERPTAVLPVNNPDLSECSPAGTKDIARAQERTLKKPKCPVAIMKPCKMKYASEPMLRSGGKRARRGTIVSLSRVRKVSQR